MMVALVELYAGWEMAYHSFGYRAGAVTGIVATMAPDTDIGKCSATRAARFMRLCDAFSIPVCHCG